MSDQTQNTEVSLWDCLHDGSLEELRSDLMARTLTIIIDSAYHREFNKLPSDARLAIRGENVRYVEVFDFEPWPGAVEPLRETPWEEAQAQRLQNYEKGRLISIDWNVFVAKIQTEEDFEIMDAEFNTSGPFSVLELEVMSDSGSNYNTVKIHAERFRFHVGNRELSLEAFQEFGAAYWSDFARRAEAREKENNV